ncbi:MAG TPA: redox-sensitive transcriptional activator SoxR [Allosphingosinicella sp.]|nr:redox-sensitive transcriptional activator SoxR [Allosphingosinicella sp.]
MNRSPVAPPKILTVGELARRGGVSVSALHFWEREGLIEGWRSAGNQRRYERATLRRVAIIRVAQSVGIPLAEIRARLDSAPKGKAGWARLAGDWRADLDRRIALLTRLRDRLDGCIGCGCLSVEDCPLRNPDDRMAGEGPGPRHLIG